MQLKFIFVLTGLCCCILTSRVFAENLPINIKKGMPYLKARKILIKKGWQTVAMHTTAHGTPICSMGSSEEYVPKIACKYEEIEDCSGTGMGFCSMYFFDGENKYLQVITAGGEPPAAQIHSWIKEKELPKKP